MVFLIEQPFGDEFRIVQTSVENPKVPREDNKYVRVQVGYSLLFI